MRQEKEVDKKLEEAYLSEEELAQLKGGRDKNKNSAYKCLCDNKPTSISNINSSIGCTCNCTPG